MDGDNLGRSLRRPIGHVQFEDLSHERFVEKHDFGGSTQRKSGQNRIAGV